MRSLSNESEILFGLGDKEFVCSLYEIFLGRTADSGGLTTFLKRLAMGDGRVAVLREIAGSKEAGVHRRSVPPALAEIITRGVYPGVMKEMLGYGDEAFVRFAYRTILRREPDDGGLATHLAAIRAGDPPIAVARRLRRSSEGRAVNADVPGLDAELSRYFWSQASAVGGILRRFRRRSDDDDILKLLRRLDNKIGRFETTAMGERFVRHRTMLADELDVDASNVPTFKDMAEPSVKVAGNIALPAQIINDGVEIKSIAILKLDHIGDFFVSIRSMAMLREAWPSADITLICGPWNVSLAERLGIFDNIVSYQFFTAKTGEEEFNWDAEDWIDRCDGVGSLNLGKFDIAIDLRHDSDTRPCLLRIDAKYRVGFASPGGPLPPTPPLDLFLLEIPPDHRDQLHAESRLVVLAALVIETFKPPRIHPIRRLLATKGQQNLPFDGDRPYLVLAPGAGSPNRTWSPENFTALMRRAIAEFHLAIAIIGPPGEAAVNAQIAGQLPAWDCLDLTGTPLVELPWLVAHAALYVGNDTGGGHLASLLGIPTLSIYGGVSDPRVWQPVGPKVTVVHSRTPCSYCHINLRKGCFFEVRCMTEISVDDAYDALSGLYKRHVSAVLTNEKGFLQ